jgi:hypothetical protein
VFFFFLRLCHRTQAVRSRGSISIKYNMYTMTKKFPMTRFEVVTPVNLIFVILATTFAKV